MSEREHKYQSWDPEISRLFQNHFCHNRPPLLLLPLGGEDQAKLLAEIIEECDPELEDPFQYPPRETKSELTSD